MLLLVSRSVHLILLLVAVSTYTQAGLLPKPRQTGHLSRLKRGSSSSSMLPWTCKQDSTLLAPDPPPAEIAQVEEHNDQLARQAFVNLFRISGGGARTVETARASPANAKRAARPQKAPHSLSSSAMPIQNNSDIVASVERHQKRDGSVSPAFPYGQEPIRGVNIGGWLVLEPWITPSIFNNTQDSSVVDEWTYGQKYGAAEAATRLKPHWDSWITEDDFVQMASSGLNHVRIPIGYWALDTSGNEPYAQGQYPYLFKAVEWAKTHGLKVIIDLHGAPGSQNGFDNSGRRGSATWHTSSNNVNRTKAVIQTLLNDFYQPQYAGVVTSIELLNEPAGFVGANVMDTLKQYYYDGYGEVRYPGSSYGNTTASELLVTLHDAFQPLPSWKGFMPSPSWQNVALDTHYYSIFSQADLQMSQDQRIQAVCNAKANLVESNKNIWTMVGEWTPADTDCAAALNGAGVGSRYDGTYPGSTRVGSCEGKTGDASTFSDDYKTFLGQYWEVQTTVFEMAAGWIQWCWKTESADEWSYAKGVEYGWIPKDPSQRKYADPCNS